MKKAFLPWKRTVLPVLLTLLLCLAGVTNAMAQSFTVGDLNYSINDDGASVTVTGHVDGTSATGELVIPESVELYGTLYPVTVIGEYAFQYCNGLTGDLVIPNSVITLGRGAFYSCHGFTGSLTIGDAVQTIGYDAFSECYGFTGSLTIGNAVQTIDGYAFHNCSGFTGTLTIPESVTQINYDAFKYCRFTTLNYNAINCYLYGSDWGDEYYHWLGYCSFLTTVNIGDSVQMIPDCFLRYRSSASGELVIPNSVTTIGNYAFENCTGFTGSLTIPNSVTTIGNNAFNGCTGFTGSLTIGNSVTLIGSSAFNGCNGFASGLNIGNSVTSIGENAFNGCSGFTGSLKIPNSVITIGNSAFNGCSGFIGAPTIGNSVVSIGENAFNGCSGFTGSLTIPNAVTTIGNSAFMNCTGFSGTLTLGQSLTEIDNSAFFGACEGFTAFTVWAVVPPTLGTNVFLSVNMDIPVYVSCGTLEAYQNASGWSSFTNLQEFDPCIWEITATAIPTVGGTVSGGGIYEQGQTCTLTATPRENYAFLCWRKNGSIVSTNSTYSFTVTEGAHYVAYFAANPIAEYYPDASNLNSPYVTVTWGNPGECHTYCENEFDNAFRSNNGYDPSWGYEYPLSVIGQLAGTWLSKVALYSDNIWGAVGGNFTCSIYLGGSIPEEGTLVSTITVDVPVGLGAWVDYELTTPVFVSGTEPLWVIWHANSTLGYDGGYPAGCTSHSSSYGDWWNSGYGWGHQSGYTWTMKNYFEGTLGTVYRDDCNGNAPVLLANNIMGQYIDEAWIGLEVGNYKYGVIYNLENYQTETYWSNCIEKHANISVAINAVPNDEDRGTVNGAGNYVQGETCTLIATANDGYMFLDWTEDGQVVSTEPQYVFTVLAERNLTANFYTPFIVFADPNVKSICVNRWDTNGDGELDYDEAAAVTNLDWAFEYKSSITSFNELQYFTGLTYINDYEFYGCQNLASITIPESVTSIGYLAFEYCHSLSSITIPESVTYINYCIFDGSGLTTINYNATNCSVNEWLCGCSLTNLTIGDNVQVIPDNFVSDQSNLVGELVIPESVTSIGGYAFYNCSGLTSATIGSSVTSIGSYAFGNCSGLTLITLPDSVTDIGSAAFYGCSGLTSITIPTSVTHLYYGTFMNCSGLTSITIPELVTSIENHVFGYCNNLATVNFNAINCPWVDADWLHGCSSLSNVTIGENVQFIPDNFVCNCTGLTSISIPEAVTSIGNNAFAGCYGLTGGLIIPNNVVSIGSRAFYNCYGLESLMLNNSVETIGSEAFRNCGGIRGELTLPETLQSVGPSAFAGCNEISTVNYNAISCQTMGNASQNVFADCLSLVHLNIGENVQSIPNYAFKPCFLVTDMRVAAEVPPTICASTFGTVPRSIPVSVPIGSGEAYRNAPYWEEFFNITEDYSPSPYSYHWTVNPHQFAGNMTVTGIIQIEGVEQAIPSLEIGAFCNGECRGRQLLTYYPQVDRYLVFLMLYGEDGDVFNFRLFDHGAGQELTAGCTSVIAFETDATIGSFSNPYVFNFTNVQISEFTEGWSWWSTYIEMAGIDGLSMLESGLGTNGLVIKSQSDGYTEYYDDYDLWYGSLGSINNESSYMVKTSVPCTVTMPGTTALPSQHPITVDANGWTWIGYPVAYDMDINAALDGLASLEGDVLKSQEGYAEFYEGYGWFGSMASFLPGRGYMYKSTSASPATFTYPSGSRGDAANANLSAKDNHWVPTVSAYPFNMTVTAVVELDGEELRSDRYELAVFANGESRGSVRLMYVEPVDRYVAFLTVAGEEAADLSFALYDTETGMEFLSANEAIAFEANATVGRLGEPFVVNFRGTTGMDELANSLHVYPNPVNAGERFSIGLNAESKAPVRVEIVNALGVETLHATSVQMPATLTAPSTAGVYTLRVTVEGKGTVVRKLVVK